MESTDLALSTGETISVRIVRKKIRNVHLRVKRDLSVVCSVPMRTKEAWIADFLKKHASWIEKQRNTIKRAADPIDFSSLNKGSSAWILGENVPIEIVQDTKNFAERTECGLMLHLKEPQNEPIRNAVFEKWWREYALSVFEDAVSRFMPIFEGYGVSRPLVRIRKMRSMWGSCAKHLGKITLNSYLLKADIRCVDYVVLHELTHLIYSGHGHDFYGFLSLYMPDWKTRRKILNGRVSDKK